MKQAEENFHILKYYFDLLLNKVGITEPDCRAEINSALDAIREELEELGRPALDNFPAPELHQPVYTPERANADGVAFSVNSLDYQCPDCGSSLNQAVMDGSSGEHELSTPEVVHAVCLCPCGCIYVADAGKKELFTKVYSFYDHEVGSHSTQTKTDPLWMSVDSYREEELCPDLDDLNDIIFEPIEPGEEP